MDATQYMIVKGPMLYFVSEGCFTRSAAKAAKYATREEAQDVISIRSEFGWKVCEV